MDQKEKRQKLMESSKMEGLFATRDYLITYD